MVKSAASRDFELDAIVVGAGVAGLYALYKLRSLGFNTRILEASQDIGGVWYANRYPGARCDTPSLQYSFSFSDEVQQEWHWPEIYAGQKDILRYVNFVAEKFKLREFIYCGEKVLNAQYDEANKRWTVETSKLQVGTARFLILATGCLSTPLDPRLPGLESFNGRTVRTSDWPQPGVNVDGQSVALIGTGSSGVQVAPILAEHAAKLYVFQRTPNYSLPLRNRRVEESDPLVTDWKKNYQARRAATLQTAGYELYLGPTPLPGQIVTYDEREQEFEKRWALGGGLAFMSAYSDMKSSPQVNAHASDFVRRKIRAIVKDQRVASQLTPEIALGAKRISADTGYYEIFNRSNVELVDLRSEPLARISPDAVQTEKRVLQVDTIVLALGFDAVTGAISKINIQGKSGANLAEKWSVKPSTYLGMTVSGFPNLFIVTGPGSPSILTNGVISGEQGVNWIFECLSSLRDRGLSTIEPTEASEARWFDYVNAIGAGSLLHSANSYAVGANVQGKQRYILPYAGSASSFRELCETIAAENYRGFVMT